MIIDQEEDFLFNCLFVSPLFEIFLHSAMLMVKKKLVLLKCFFIFALV